jgi:hypothetical protein
MGRQLTVARDLLVGSIRDFGLLKDVVEGMVATIRFTVTMPEPDLADAGSIRDFGLLKDVVEDMVATIRFTVTMPDLDLADAGSAQPDANDGRAFADPSKAA